jgi:fructose/tagatose bisphosphate aldolase
MPDLKVITQNALNAGVAIPAFNVPYLPMVEPVVQAVVDRNSFALIETARLEWFKFEAGSPEAVAQEFFRWQNPVHVSLHLDHIPVIDEDGQRVDYISDIQRAIDLGYHSVMVDGSRLPQAGPLPPYDELFVSGRGFTKVDEARHFVVETGCDWLSVAIGNIHGAISTRLKGKKKIAARLDLDHLQSLARATSIPLVLHGGSGIPQEYVLESFKKGIAKINIATEIRQVYESALQSTGKISTAQKAVYQRTTWLIREYFGLENLREKVVQEAS